MSQLRVIVGHESSPTEMEAVREAFTSPNIEVHIDNSLMRMSNDWQSLPMTIMVFAQALAPNIIWDLIKYAARRIFEDPRLKKRPPTIVVKRSTYDVVFTEDRVYARSIEETREFMTVEDLIKFEQKENTQSSER